MSSHNVYVNALSNIVNSQNPTGYSQVLEETFYDGSNTTLRQYTLGHDVIGEAQRFSSPLNYIYDGHGSVRASMYVGLSSPYINTSTTYDASGNIVNGFATSPLGYSGEWTDRTGQQYLRSRYYDPGVGRFSTLDGYAGNSQDPASLHKYLYVHGDPINGIDPRGMFFTAAGAMVSASMSSIMRNTNVVSGLAVLDRAQNLYDASILVGQLVTTGTINYGIAAGLLSQIVPFGNMLGKARLTISSASKGLFGVVKGKIDNVADELTDIYRGFGREVSEKAVQNIGEMGAILTAKKLGFQAIEDFPTRNTGIDGLFWNGSKLVIVEAKGGSSRLGKTKFGGQMSQQWIEQKIVELRNVDGGKWSRMLRDAIDANPSNLQGMVVNTKINKSSMAVKDPTFTLKDWDEIGSSKW